MKNIWVNQRGVALIAVLWMVAAMGLIISGIVQAVRSEVRAAGLQRQILVTNALADAAILLALQNMHAQQKGPRNSIQTIPVQFEGRTSDVSVRPLNGLIDINNATAMLISGLYRHVGGMNPDAAQALAQATIEVRQLKSIKGVASRFEAIEDLLRVPGMTYALYVKINNFVTSDIITGSGKVNALAAPIGVLEVLTDGDRSRAAVLASKRDADPNLMDTSFLKPELVETASSRSLRFQVSIDLPGGGSLQKAWHVYWDTDLRSGLPWRILGTKQSIQRAN